MMRSLASYLEDLLELQVPKLLRSSVLASLGLKLGKRGGCSSMQMQLLGLMINKVLQLTQMSRETESIEFSQGRRYFHAVQSAGLGRAAPHLYRSGSLLVAVAFLTGDEQDRQHNDQYTATFVEDRAQVIRLCHTAKCFRAEEKKVISQHLWWLLPNQGARGQLVARTLATSVLSIHAPLGPTTPMKARAIRTFAFTV